VRTTPESLQKALNMAGKMNDVRNVVPLLKTIKEAYDQQRLCLVRFTGPQQSGSSASSPIFQLKILDPSLGKETYHESKTFDQLSQETFQLPTGTDGGIPFTWCLNYHSQTSHYRAIRRGWIEKESVIPKYGTPMDDIKLHAESPKSQMETPTTTFDDTDRSEH